MTISSTTRKAGPFDGNGVTTVFPFKFKLFATSDLRVVRADALGVETDLVHVTDCTVTLNADQDENPGGSVVLNVPLAEGFRLVLLSAVPELQPVDLTNQGGFYPELVNGGLDRATVQVQQLREQMSRSITVPVTSEPGDLSLPSPAPGQLLGWTDSGLTNFDPAELVSVVAFGATRVDKFDGDGTTAVFSLSASPGVQNNLRVSIAGVVQVPGEDFTWSGGVILTFAAAPPAGTRIVAQYQEALTELGSAAADLSNVPPEAFSSKAFPIPLGGGNQAPVPVDIKTRWSNYASFEDFGIRLYEDDGVTVRDNTTRVQEAIDKLQPYNGVLFAPPNRDGSTVVITGPVTLRTGTIGGKNYTGAGMAIVGVGPGDRASWQHGRYDLGQGFKLKAGSAGALITSPVGAGQLTLENLMLSGDAQNQKGIHLVDNPGGPGDYGFGGFFKQVYINGFLGGGAYLGANRGRGATEWMWVEYSGTAGGAAALFQGSADWEHVGIGIGVNNGPGIYVGAASQVRFFGGASWMNEVAVVVSEDCLDVDFFGVHFDNSQKNNIDVRAYTGGGAGRRGGRKFFGCRTSDASQLAANTYSSIILRANTADTQFVGHDFMGGFSGGVLPKYAVETEAGAIFWADAFPVSTDANKPYATAFTNDWTRVRLGGWDAAGLGVGNGGQSLIARADGAAVAEFRQNDAYLGGPAGQHALRANRMSGGSYNRVLVQSTSSGFDFAQIVADSDGASCDLVLSPKGPGVLRFGAYTAGAITADGYIRIKLADGSFARILVDKE